MLCVYHMYVYYVFKCPHNNHVTLLVHSFEDVVLALKPFMHVVRLMTIQQECKFREVKGGIIILLSGVCRESIAGNYVVRKV